MNNILVCPVCKRELKKIDKAFVCPNSHSFDIAKEGYVNLLIGSKPSDKMGDSKDSAKNRRAFLDSGYFEKLKTTISSLMVGTVLDICCGEGYYDTPANGAEVFAFDISKNMVRLAAKRKNGANYFVANLASIPVKDKSVDTAFNIFAPFNDKEFERVLCDDGCLFTVIPGKEHLYEIKNLVYEKPYYNDEKAPSSSLLKEVERIRVKTSCLVKEQDILSLFAMTPYFYRTGESDKKKLIGVGDMQITFDFIVVKYQKNCH